MFGLRDGFPLIVLQLQVSCTTDNESLYAWTRPSVCCFSQKIGCHDSNFLTKVHAFRVFWTRVLLQLHMCRDVSGAMHILERRAGEEPCQVYLDSSSCELVSSFWESDMG